MIGYLLISYLVLFSFIVMKTYGLTCLLTLEIVVILIFIGLLRGAEPFFCLFLLCVGACEGAVGLSCLVRIVRAKGSQQVLV